MKAFLMAAGLGTRLRPLTDVLPKPLIRVKNIPSISYALLHIREAGINDIIINLHYRGDDIKDFFKIHNNFGFNITYSFEEEILGTGGGVMKCRSQLEDDIFLVINSDVVTDINLKEMYSDFNKINSKGIIAIKSSDSSPTVSLNNNCVADFKNDLLTDIIPGHDYMGIAFLSPEIFQFLTGEFSSIVYTGYTSLIKNYELHYYNHEGFWYDIGTLDGLHETEKLLEGEERFMKRLYDAQVVPVS